jgi:hypothetical protein
VRSAEREIRNLLRQKAEVMKRIGTIKQTMAGLANLFGDSILSDELLALLERKSARQSGFTRGCRTVLMESAKPLGARQVCEQLQRRFPGLLERQKVPLASVTTVLSRLVQYSEARCSVDEKGRRVWEWIAEGNAVATTPEGRHSLAKGVSAGQNVNLDRVPERGLFAGA